MTLSIIQPAPLNILLFPDFWWWKAWINNLPALSYGGLCRPFNDRLRRICCTKLLLWLLWITLLWSFSVIYSTKNSPVSMPLQTEFTFLRKVIPFPSDKMTIFLAETSRSTQPLIQPAIYHLAFIIYNFSRNRVRMRSEQFYRSGV